MSDWEKVERNNDDEVFLFDKEGDEIVGTLIDRESEVGPNKSWMYTIKTVEGTFKIWGSANIDSALKTLELDTEVKILFKGMSHNERNNRDFKNFEIFTKKK